MSFRVAKFADQQVRSPLAEIGRRPRCYRFVFSQEALLTMNSNSYRRRSAAVLPSLAVLLSLAVPDAVSAGPYTGAYFIGDSQTDGGNGIILTSGATAQPPFDPVPSLPYDSGTITNGPVWANYLAQGLGLSAAPSLLGGSNFAIGGTRVATGAGSLSVQTDQLLSAFGGSLPPDGLFAVWGGGNDVLDALNEFATDPLAAQATIANAVVALDDILRRLAGAGAQHLLVLNLGDTGLAPLVNSPLALPGTAAVATGLTESFNTQFTLALVDLVLDLPGLNLMTFDVFALSGRVAGDPSAYGLTNSTDACLSFGESEPAQAYCAAPDEYVFWDAIHTTTAFHAVLGSEVLSTIEVPAPAPWLLLLMLLPAMKRLVPPHG